MGIKSTLKDITGQRFGRLLITGRDLSWKKKCTRWLYLCDCGTEGSALVGNLRKGDISSCGCLRTEQLVARYTKHGQGKEGGRSPAYSSWSAMWTRVSNPNSKRWKDYGGRGITVCDRWRDFENFFADMGHRPEGLSLERREVNGNYEPNNCYWADDFTQANNQRNQTRWLIDSQLMTKSQARRHWGATDYMTKKRLSTIPYAEGEVPKWLLKWPSNSTLKE